jgi:hypothetical protein
MAWLFLLSSLVTILSLGHELSVNEFGESVSVAQANKTMLLESPSTSAESDDVDQFLEKTYPNMIRVTKLNYVTVLKQQPLSVLLVHDERQDGDGDEQSHLLESVLSAASERSQSSELIKVQFLHLDARSSACEDLLGGGGVWKMRKSYYEEETVSPSCFNRKDGTFVPQLWLFHWKDLSMMSPLRFSTPLSNGELASLPLNVVSAKMIADTLSNLVAMDLAYVS